MVLWSSDVGDILTVEAAEEWIGCSLLTDEEQSAFSSHHLYFSSLQGFHFFSFDPVFAHFLVIFAHLSVHIMVTLLMLCGEMLEVSTFFRLTSQDRWYLYYRQIPLGNKSVVSG